MGAAVLAGIRHGLTHKIAANAPVESYGAADPNMPSDWRSAIVAAEGSDFLKSALGPELHRALVAIKWAEYARVSRHVSALDFDLYLHRV